jgi:hypothetical protein
VLDVLAVAGHWLVLERPSFAVKVHRFKPRPYPVVALSLGTCISSERGTIHPWEASTQGTQPLCTVTTTSASPSPCVLCCCCTLPGEIQADVNRQLADKGGTTRGGIRPGGCVTVPALLFLYRRARELRSANF